MDLELFIMLPSYSFMSAESVVIVPISLLILAFCVISPSLWQFVSSFFFLLFLAKFYEFY